jgi:hypothetical protein
MYLVALLDHLRRNARCLVVVALALTGAFVLPLQVSAAGATERVAATPADPAGPVAPAPNERLKPKPGQPECPTAVATCDDLTIDPCIPQQSCPPPSLPPCRDGVLSRRCPPPRPCNPDDPEHDCPEPPCEPADPEYRGYPPDHKIHEGECPPPTECEKGDPECPEPPKTGEPDPGVDRPVPATPNFTG